VRRAVAALALLLAAPQPAAAVPACLVPDWDDACEAWVATYDGPHGGQYGDDQAVAAVVDPRGTRTYAVADEYDGAADAYDALVLARDTATGRVVWRRLLRAVSGTDRAGSVAVSPDGRTVYVTVTLDRGLRRGDGITFEVDDGWLATYALDARDGRTLWAARERRNGGATAGAVAVAGGTVYATGVDGERTVLHAYDARSGRRRWTRTAPGEATSAPSRLVADARGVVWLSRVVVADVGAARATRITAAGRVEWTKDLGPALPAALALTGDGGTYVATETWNPQGAVLVGYNPPSSVVTRLDARGRVVWSTPRGERVTSLAATPGRVWLAIATGVAPVEAVAEELDPRSGTTRWRHTAGDPRMDFAAPSVVPLGRGVALVAGGTNRGFSYCLSVAYGAEGEPRWTARWQPGTTEEDTCAPVGAGVDVAGRLVVTARAAYTPARQREVGAANFADVVTAAYAPGG
jgi:outer membrane protein assembly factor BamB